MRGLRPPNGVASMNTLVAARERELLAAIALMRKALTIMAELPGEVTPGAVLTIRAVARHALGATEQSVAPMFSLDPTPSDPKAPPA